MLHIDETLELALHFNAAGLLPVIVCDARDGEVLMFAYMNRDAFELTRQTGLIHFWSRSRNRLWKKGERSGETFEVLEYRVDCDQDCLQVLVFPNKTGAACHTGRRSCFYRRIEGNHLQFRED